MRRDTRAAYRRRAADTERTVAAAVAAVDAERAEEFAAATRAHDEREASRNRLTRDDLVGATHVRTQFGWHKVARVNKTTVSVETGYSWVDRYPFDKIHEAR